MSTTSVPPPLTVVSMAEPNTASAPPLSTVVPVAVPPEDTISVGWAPASPPLTVARTVVPPKYTISVPPLLIVVKLAVPPEDRMRSAQGALVRGGPLRMAPSTSRSRFRHLQLLRR